MRVVHVISGLERGGAELFLEKLIQSHSVGQFENRVISLGSIGPVGKRLRDRGGSVNSLHIGGVIGAVPGLVSLGWLLRKVRPDLVQGWLYNGNLAAGVSKHLSSGHYPVLWNVRHSLDGWADETWFLRNEIRVSGRLTRMPQRIVFNSKRSARQHERLGYPRAKACVIPNGFDLAKFVPDTKIRSEIRVELEVDSDDVVIGMIGRYHPLKDHANLLQAARIVASKSSGVRFVLAGRRVTTENEALMKLVRELQLEDRLVLLGERTDVADLLSAFDIYVLSSSSEAFPNAVGEAMSCEVPCVVTDVGDSAELVGNTGIVVPPKSPERLAAAMLQLIQAGAVRRRELGAAARERIRQNYSFEKVAQQYADLYRSVSRLA